jgi:hypothetical protein
MTQQEVEAILGGPPEFLDDVGDVRSFTGPNLSLPTERWEVWSADLNFVSVGFGPDGLVKDKAFASLAGPRPSLLERARRWLGW